MVFLVDVSELKNFIKMITLRTLATAVLGILTIAGGERDRGKKAPSFELFDSSTGQWYTTDNLPLPHSRLQAVIVNTSFTCKDLGGIPTVFTASLDTIE